MGRWALDWFQGPRPLQGFLCCLLSLSFFTVWFGSADPWWRPKEWAVLVAGLVWIGWRTLCPPRAVGKMGVSIFLGALLIWIALQTSFLHILPVVQAPGRYVTHPWVWLTYFHLVLLMVWYSDMVRSLKLEDLKPVWSVVGWIGLILSVLMLLQFAGRDPVIFLLERKVGTVRWLHGNHVIGLMGGPFQAGACLAICVPVLVALNRKISLTLAALALLATGSASAIVSAFCGALAVLWTVGKRSLFVSLSFLGIGCALVSHWKGFFSFSGRIPLWTKSIEMWKESFLLQGTGLGTYKLLGITAATANPDAPNTVRWAHNEWIQIGMELGAVGLILFTLFIGSVFLSLWKRPNAIPAGILVTGAILSVASIPFHLAPVVITLVVSLAAVAISSKGV